MLVARLRAEGWPISVIRAIARAELHDQLAARYYKDLLDDSTAAPFWSYKWNTGPDPKVLAAQRTLAQEESKAMRDLLGSDAVDDDALTQYWRRRQFGDMPPDKLDQVQRISSDYNEIRNEIFRLVSGGLLTADDQATLAYLDREKQDDLAKVLTPAELDDFEMRSSQTATTLRAQLSTFEPTEEEFRALFHAAQAIRSRLGQSSDFVSGAETQQYSAALTKEAKSLLSPERYAEYVQATDPRLSALDNIVRRYELPKMVVSQVGALQKDFQQQAQSIRAQSSVGTDERNARLNALAEQAGSKIGAILGDSAFETYRQGGGFDSWFKPLP